MKNRIVVGVVIVVAIAAAVSVKISGPSSTFYTEVAPVEAGEYLTVPSAVDESIYIFGYRVLVWHRKIEILGVEVRDLESGKLIGKYHGLDVNICPHCNGTGEVK